VDVDEAGNDVGVARIDRERARRRGGAVFDRRDAAVVDEE